MDTNVLLQLFGPGALFRAIRQSLLAGTLVLVLSNEIMLEYEEAITRFSGSARWRQIAAIFEALEQFHGNVVRVQPTFRFNLLTTDPDDNKFVDAAIVAGADFVVTSDRHFQPLAGAGYRPQPIKPEVFILEYL